MLTRHVAFAKLFKSAAEMLRKRAGNTALITQITELLTYFTESVFGQ